jgi:hypothetical protein
VCLRGSRAGHVSRRADPWPGKTKVVHEGGSHHTKVVPEVSGNPKVVPEVSHEGGSRGFRRWFQRFLGTEGGSRGFWEQFHDEGGSKVVPEVSGNSSTTKVVPEVSEGGSRGFWERFHPEGGSRGFWERFHRRWFQRFPPRRWFQRFPKVVPEVSGNEERRYPQSSVIESQGTLVTAWIART